MRRPLLAVLPLLLLAAPAAVAQTRVVPRAQAWSRPSGKSKPTRITTRTRRVRIEVSSGGCATYDHAEVRRTRDAVVITAIFNALASDSPYTTIPCPSGIPKVVTVGLRGRLGHRAVEDGSTTPPMPRYAGRGRVGVADVRHLPVARAYDRVRGYGFRVAIPEPFAVSHVCPDTAVARQFPAAGTVVRRGTVVRFTRVECGPAASYANTGETYTVRNVVGQPPSIALYALGGIQVDQSYAALPPSTFKSFDANYRVAAQSQAPGTKWRFGSPPVAITLH